MDVSKKNKSKKKRKVEVAFAEECRMRLPDIPRSATTLEKMMIGKTNSGKYYMLMICSITLMVIAVGSNAMVF